jgi:hypothetical protein
MPYTTDSRAFDKLCRDNPSAVTVLAEGDSWFAFPRRYILFGDASNVVQVLSKKNDYNIYSTASNGDEVLSMLSGEQKFSLMKRLSNTHFDVLMFSGGGNDIVGRYDFDYLLKDGFVDYKRLSAKLAQIKFLYIELVERVLEYSKNPNIKIVTHMYDFPVPSDEGFELFDLIPLTDSWMKPFMVKKGIVDPEKQRSTIKEILSAFAMTLTSMESLYPGIFHVANTQGTLNEDEWRDEIHPTPEGFGKITKIIDETIQSCLDTHKDHAEN